jgi:DNA-binding SARP family transcriptional activator/TolB-like protein
MKDRREPSVVANVKSAQVRQLRPVGDPAGLRVHLLGPMTVTLDGRSVAIAARKARALLGYLALREGSEIARGVLTGLLWGERGEGQARASLRQTLSELRGALGETASSSILASKEAVAWERGSAWIDTRLVESAAGSTDEAALREAAALAGGELMEGLTVGEAGFEQWLTAERERFRLIACGIHARLMERAEQHGRLEEALAHGLKLLSLDPLQEHVHRGLMRLYAAQGRHDAALAQYERCRRQLSSQLGVRPERETEDLAHSIRTSRRNEVAKPQGQLSPSPEIDQGEGHASPDRPSIAALQRGAAVMACDVVGYSSVMEEAAERTAGRLGACKALILEKVALLHGRIFSAIGNATLAEFPSANNAVRCATEIRNALAGVATSGSESPKMRFGLHLADVLFRGDDLVGDDANLAACIQQAAEPDTILVSESLFDRVRRNSPFVFDDIGERSFENISEPIRVYRVRGEMGKHRLQSAPTKSQSDREKRPCSIAILPFRVTGDHEDQRFLAEGLTEELIVELGRFRRLFVTSRSASFALAESALDPVKIGNALSVRYVLEGQLRKINDRVRIGLTLTETETGVVEWSDKIVRPFGEVLDLLDEVAAKIAATVFGRVEDASMVAARRKLPENMTAFECLLRGLDHHRLGGVTDDNAREAVKWFTKAIEIDPNYAAAYAWRVCSAGWLPEFDFQAGERDARRALELDPHDPESHRIMATFELMKENHERAAALIRRAVELNPSDAYTMARGANVSTYAGDATGSLALLDEAEALDPFLPVWCIEERGVALYSLDRYEEALEAHGKLAFQTYRSRLYRAAALVALSRLDEARKLINEAIASKPDITVSAFVFNERYRDLEKRRELRRRLEEAGLPE